MGNYKIHAWSIIEEGFDPERVKASESIFSIGNGHMGQRANFEEAYTGNSLSGSYVAGIYYPDKTRVGWWKNGYPEYFAKVINAPSWIGVDVRINTVALDLAQCQMLQFQREIDMRRGVLLRRFTVAMPDGCRVGVEACRFVSMARPQIGVVRYCLTALDDMDVVMTACLDGIVYNEDSNYGEMFWDITATESGKDHTYLQAKTKKLDFTVALSARSACSVDGVAVSGAAAQERHTGWVGTEYFLHLKAGQVVVLEKYVSVLSSRDFAVDTIRQNAAQEADAAVTDGYDFLLREHCAKWDTIWHNSDIIVEGDDAAQQGIRFNIFQLNQTYTGLDARLNIGPKGFTGEKYGGTTYWDTEAYCLPFYLATAPSAVSRNLLLYRYRHLGKAIENAEKLGFGAGAALFPWVTMNGEECHNEWEITFEELHRNGAIAFAIYNYMRHTDDFSYLCRYGLEVLIGIARFWSQRISFSPEKQKYVMLGVTGPNEYENNINNNWYTNTLAVWCMRYAAEVAAKVRKTEPESYAAVATKTHFDFAAETAYWQQIWENMYYPYDAERQIFLQQEGYLDKEPITVADLDPAIRPLNQHWSWDRILRSPFIKQADTLQGIYMFEDAYDTAFIKRHYAFYEARTVHESSLSPCIHAILAARIGDMPKAYELYLRTARLDLDDYNREVDEGLHITSMAGSWMSVVEGFGGKRMRDGKLSLAPQIPAPWQSYSFRILLQDQPLQVRVDKTSVSLTFEGDAPVVIALYGTDTELVPGKTLQFPIRTIV